MADLLHELVSQLRNLALELQRTPTKQEFCQNVAGGHYKVVKLGGYNVLVKAAGLEPNTEHSKRVDNTIFIKNLEDHLNAYIPKNDLPTCYEAPPRIAVISDIHWPFASKKVLEQFYKFIEKHQPEYVIINGDAWDMFSHSKYPRSHNVFTPEMEHQLAREANEVFWETVQKLVPNAKCYQLLGNHDIRPIKRILEVYPVAEDWISTMLQKLFNFEGVQTIHDPRQELMLPSNIAVHHGYRSKLGDHRDYMLQNAIVGHTHTGGATFRRLRGEVLWELNSGVAGDPELKGLSYTPQKITHWTPGFGWVDEYGPRFVVAK